MSKRPGTLRFFVAILCAGLAGQMHGELLPGLPLALQDQTSPAQTGAAPAPGRTTAVSKLNINVVEGAGAVNNVRTRAARELGVEVDDENDKPVPGAMVTFFAPNEGPGGTFAGDSQLITVMTDKEGRALVNSFRPNGTAGDYKIQVTASYGDQVANATISQANQIPTVTTGASSHNGKKVGIIVAVVAVAGVGAALGLGHGGSNSSSSTGTTTPTATIGTGTGVTVGSPH